MSKRISKKRIDYKLFNSTGNIVSLEDESTNQLSTQLSNLSITDTFVDNMPDSDDEAAVKPISEDAIDLMVMSQEVMDIIDENSVHDLEPDELKSIITKLQEIRTSIRKKQVKVTSMKERLDEDLKMSINHAMLSIKDFIKSANDVKAKSKLQQERVKYIDATQKDRTITFLLQCTDQSMDELERAFSRNTKEADSTNLINWRKELPTINSTYEKIRENYKECLEASTTNADILDSIKSAGEKYTQLDKKRQKFISDLNQEICNRELDKHAEFKKSQLNIKIEKFSGYDTATDFYTFRTNFEKLHLNSTPKELLPDLLCNNYLSDPALTMVKNLDSIEEIWERLRESFGDTKILLTRRLQQIRTLDLSKKDPEKLISALSKLINIMKEVSTLAGKHDIEEHLYYGDSIARINQLIGDRRSTRFITEIYDLNLSPKATWMRLINFLTKEMRIHEQKRLLSLKTDLPKKEDFNKHHGSKRTSAFHSQPPSEVPSYTMPTCSICDAPDKTLDHISTSGPKGSKILQYYTCKDFVNMSPADRLHTLKQKGYCFQCLYPGANISSGKHAEGKCQHDFICPHSSHQKYPIKKHVLVCEEHKSDEANQQLLHKFIQKFVRSPALPEFAKKISLYKVSNDTCNDRGIYLLQRIRIDNNDFLIFYDNGCSDFVISEKGVQLLGSRAKQISSQPVTLGGVGNTQTRSQNGMYRVNIPMSDGTEASFSGVCLPQITEKFPTYPLEAVEKDLHKSYQLIGGTKCLPRLPSSIGGEVHMMIGIKYLRYHPKMEFQLSSGLTLYESKFDNSTGGRGVIGGPHKAFTAIHQNFNTTFFTEKYNDLRMRQADVPLLGFGNSNFKSINESDDIKLSDSSNYLSTTMRVFEEVEATGSEISYRCLQCRNCKTCKHGSTNDIISIKEEVEQNIINSSVNIDLQTGTTKALLPFIADPITRLADNKDRAMKVYLQQLRKLNNPSNHKDKQDILESEAKLQQLGYVDFVRNLSQESQRSLRDAKMHYYIPWRAVWKGNSVSTPCRIVFDASQPTSSGFSLNDVIAKGRNNLNKLQEILLRWSVPPIAIATDIKKMYNTIKLEEQHWCYQRYLWQDDLDATKQPEEKIIKTLIYGVKSSGNQAEYALRKVAEMSKDEFPEVNDIIHNDVYVDDCLTGEIGHEEAHHRFDQFEIVINRGGFEAKGVAFSGEKPPPSLSDDGETVFVAGMRWFVQSDMVSLNIGDLNFAKKHRGKKPLHLQNVIPKKLTRRHCASKVAEVFDLSGKVSPLVASMKIDLQELVRLQLDWDDVIPENLRPQWESNFQLIKDIGTLKFRRAVVPEDAVNLDINTIDFADASRSMVCVAIYARFLRRNGKYSCQLIFSRTRTVPKDYSQPRSELYAALINSHAGETVRRSLSKWHKSSIKLTDSQIVLHWIENEEKPLKQWVRNRVVEIKRFTEKQQWYYVNTENMIADIGTRKGATINDVNSESIWINGHEWMQLDVSEFPIKSASDLKLDDSEISEMNKESYQVHFIESIPVEFQERYKYSKYLIDPNRRSFTSVVRILAYVIRFCNLLRKRHPVSKSNNLTDDEISIAERYFFQKATNEVIQFVQPKRYEPISVLKDGILVYNGRILPSSQVTVVGRYTDAMLDLTSTSFCVPIIDKNSPIAFSIVSDVHWNSKVAKHAGIETTLRQVMKKVFIIDGRSLVKIIKKSCKRCRYLNKQTIEATMGPIPETSMTIAPAFYFTQLDLSGPYKAFSPQHKRTTVKIWLVVYCCCTTSATSINVMDDYSTTAFILSFTRFASKYGFPKKLFCDEGSQLMKGTKDMRLTFNDIKFKLHRERSIEMETCPVAAHNMHGKVERKIKEINASLERSIQHERLSILQWETICAVIANSINDLPIAIKNYTDVENMDLLTPNRLILGRSNDRSPSGNVVVSTDPSKILNQNTKIYDAWFESWLLNHVPKLMAQTKWFDHDRNLKVGDVVLFTKVDSVVSKNYTYGMISKVETGDDGNVRRVMVKYQNSNENVPRETMRSVRNLVLINSVDECDIMNDIGEMACATNKTLNSESKKFC